MNLLELPPTVKDRIYHLMDIHEVFLFSTCSKKTNQEIKSSKLNSRFDGIKLVSETYVKGSISVCRGNDEFRTVVEWENQRKKSKNLMRIDGLVIKCRIKYHSKSGVPVIYIEEYQKTTPIAMYNYISSLFNTTILKELRIRRSDFSDLPSGLTAIQNVMMDTYCQYADPDVFENFFKRTKIENCFISEQILRGSLNEKISMMDVPNVYLEQASWLPVRQLRQFTGRNVLVENTKFRNLETVYLVKAWLQGHLGDLESMIIGSEYSYRFPEALAGIERQPWNRAVRAQRYVYKAAFRDFFQKEFDFLDCADAHDVRRNDGKLASIKFVSETKAGITRHYFFMFVWNSRFPEAEPFQNTEPGLRFL